MPSFSDFRTEVFGLSVADVKYQAPSWKESRRVIVVREEIAKRLNACGRCLFNMPDYTFHAIVTTLAHSPEDVWRFYNSRADCENRIKELKDDFGADGFCLQSFDGTEGVFRIICFLFNLIADFKRNIIVDERPRMSTLRNSLLVIGAILGMKGRDPVLRLGLRGQWQMAFQALLDRIEAVVRSTAAQLVNLQEIAGLMPLRPWRLRRCRRHTPDWLSPGWLLGN
jgi:hypothetical protein